MTAMKKKSIVARVSIGLDAQTLDALEQALKVRYVARFDNVTQRERGCFLQLAVLAYSGAVARLGKEYEVSMLACDLRTETPEERAIRNGEPLQEQLAIPDNIIPLFATDCLQAG